jgi:uncharacterized membrane protein YjjP (DUF1212 family)
MTKITNNAPFIFTEDGKANGHGGNGHGNNDDNNIYNYSAIINRIDKTVNKHTDDINDLKEDLKDVKQDIKDLRKLFVGLGASLVAMMFALIGIMVALFVLQQGHLDKILETRNENVDLQIKQFDDKFAAQSEANERAYQLALEALKKSTEPPTR